MSTNPMNNLPTMHQQQGAALIAVLMVLILILIISVVAVRKSSTDLKTATADQMSTVLLQSAESANQKLESVVNGPVNNAAYHNLVESNAGAFGYFIADSQNNHNRGDEFVFCQNNGTNYLRNRATIFRGGGTMGGNGGFCQVGQGAYTYTTNRETVATQVSIILPQPVDGVDEDVRGFAHRVTPTGESIAESYEFDVYATSVIPSYGNPDGCFANSSVPNGNNPSPLMDCLTRSNSPYKIIYQRALVAQETNLINR